MREILFRGKRVDTGEWVEGKLPYHTEEKSIICTNDYIPIEYVIDPSTVGQYIGIKDSHKRKIFEGDKIRVVYENGDWDIRVVRYYAHHDYPAFDLDGYESEANGISESISVNKVYVTGNIHDK